VANANRETRQLIEGQPVLLVIDIQKSTFINRDAVRAIDNMPDYRERMEAARAVLPRDGARHPHRQGGDGLAGWRL